jgi:hypothetical protein
MAQRRDEADDALRTARAKGLDDAKLNPLERESYKRLQSMLAQR